jgi:ribosomal protein L37AE/L43A
VKIKCPKCKKDAELTRDFSTVKCENCNLEMSYGEYVKFVAHSDATYSDILGDYTGSTEGQTAGTLDDWDSQSG